MGLPPEGLYLEGVETVLIEDYNCPPESLEHLSDRVREVYSEMTSAKEETPPISLEKFRRQHGGKSTIVCELDVARITALATSNLMKARQLLDSYDVRIEKRS